MRKNPKNKTVLADIYVEAEGECPECGNTDVSVDVNVEATDVLDANWPEAVIAYYGMDVVLKVLVDMMKAPKTPDDPDVLRQMLEAVAKHIDDAKTDIEFQMGFKGKKLTPKGERMYNEIDAAAANIEAALNQYVRYRTLERFCEDPVYEE